MTLNPGRDAIGAAIGTATPYAGLTPIVSKQVQALVAASRGKVRLVSGYRTLAEQQAMYEEAGRRYGTENAGAWVADPAHSNHVKGSAVDLAGDLSVIRQLAPQFGLTAPMAWEPWHLEMASTPQHASPNAYTTAPPGEQNPVGADMSQSAPHVAASLAESLMGMGNESGTGTAGTLDAFHPQGDALSTVLATAPQPVESGAQPAQGPQGPDGAQGTNMTGKGNVAPNKLYAALTQAGLPATAAAAFVSIAGRESGYNTNAFNGNHATGDESYGLFQINLLNGGWTDFLKAHGLANPSSDLRTLEGSVKAAAAIYASSGLHPWGGYKGVPWWNGTNLDAGAQASGGQVSTAQMESLGGG